MPSSLNVPNLLSLSRIFLAPLVVFLLTVRIDLDIPYLVNLGLNITYGDIFAGVVFIIAALTDTADGYIARKKGIVTNFGKFIDPLSDKVLVVAALISLVELGRLPAWMVVVIVSRDFVVSGLRMVAAVEGVVIAASWAGKAKTVVQIVAISMMIFNVPLAFPAMWLALLLTVWSGAVYLANGWELIVDTD
ncbi:MULTISPECIES: CDP-diacylglycerol--glycerol-3-phosphate 3-phosphatidyltransferase [Dethiosulfovibrio]|jgi:CDP-diacylglycerol--glycerol-3-phosphate 3-phosphatidyltransferase|uniref:CDP-diacylglycerol--glycerol-3-phosphate 3-phosphatidyltransferase n=2 Tax=Dethiosulfovibrio TaxID=47054 RepID=A0ABS9ENH0_9BACT|nr:MULTISPECIES: CDP-diacylglycerol--glycerol-3-phosphate 3-phosphatidyltransferase [Dethiosulfovibrio]MCF4113865.1 CDP-diacylglycerol--glycerol-3-phosphate 3-phosphatidyltransferase [Dethiosulfovibrio russensis]MCF4141722.1 CDP-diacylglycerol--glycerol-3-phosphate 3-phosphatidyltransferase [Dethiosulfovibrio marinus]MCF4143861.1 CDP-diacylglycerol--glycerol-3-phosphate 3-phosphatidyltransferase [Dethiosulfovibrio acidaminovorans]MEA3284041.1 CDP-diacylglycerol--glycerol-3-phosphate 3-phosphati